MYVRLFFFILFFFHFSVNIIWAQETTLSLGISGDAPDSAPKLQALSTNDIDPYLSQLPGQPFGPAYTRDRANVAFASFNELKQRLANVLSAQIAANPSVKSVESVNLKANPLRLRVSQQETKLLTSLKEISADVQLVAKGVPVICASARARFTVTLSVGGTYDVYSGNIEGSNIQYKITNKSIDCSGLLGFLGEITDSIFGVSNDRLDDAIRAAVNSAAAAANMQKYFSVKGIINGLQNSTANPVLTNLGSQGIHIASQILSNPNLRSLGFVLDFEIFSGSENTISFIGSAKPVDVMEIEYGLKNMTVLIEKNSYVASTDIYYRSNPGSSWAKVASTTSDTVVVRPVPLGSELVAIARSNLIPGLSSLRGAGLKVTYDYYCRRACPPLPAPTN
jgi:hypothetical protein